MYDYIKGKLVEKTPTNAVIDINGIGYLLNISLSTWQELPDAGELADLKVHLHVREDIFQLYGFAQEKERDLFHGLISVSGVGPKLAQTILSGLTPDKLLQAIRIADEKTLNGISGVGKKTAQRLIVELKDKLKNLAIEVAEDKQDQVKPEFREHENEALMALIALGYNRQKAENSIIKAMSGDKVITTEELIKKALQGI